MFQRQAHIELFGNADGGKDIVGLVCMGFQGNGVVQHRQQGFQLLVISGHFGHIAVGGSLAGTVIPGGSQRPAQERSSGHAGRIAFIFIAALGVFAKGAFHGNGFLDDHVVHTLAHRLDGGKGTAQHISAARPGAHAGNSCFPCMGKGGIARVDAVNGAQLRGPDVIHLVVVVAFVPDAITIQADMGVRIHKTGENIQPGSIQHGDIGGHVQFMPHGNNAAVFQQQVDLLWFRVNGIMNPAPAHQQRRGGMFCILHH